MPKFSSTLLPATSDLTETRKAILDLLDKINRVARDNSGPPVGGILPYGGAVAPTGYLLCDGSSYLRAEYAALFLAIGTGFGAVDGMHFSVPDLREAAPVGVGTRGAGVTAHDAFTLAQFKDDQEQGHWHYVITSDSGAVGAQRISPAAGTTNRRDLGPTTRAETIVEDGVNGTPRLGTVTRGKRLGVNYIIKT